MARSRCNVIDAIHIINQKVIMRKYRIVQTPIIGGKDQFLIEAPFLVPSPWWSSKPPTEKWAMINESGMPWYTSYSYGPTEPPIGSFDTEEEAKEWIDTRRAFRAKKSKVVFEIEI